jgi:hypothetical protein
MMAQEIKAAKSPYSIAVTPDSLRAARSVLERYLDIWALHVEKLLQNQEPGRRAAGEVSILKQVLRWRIIPNAAL